MRVSPGTGTVLFVCACLLGLNLSAALLAGQASGPETVAVLTSIIGALLIPVFWLGSARLVDSGARRMGAANDRGRFRDHSGRTYTILLIYAALGVMAAGSHRWLPAADPVLQVIVPLLALGSLVWFMVAGVRAVRRVYDVPSLNAVTLAFLPYATLCALVVTLVLVISVVQAVAG